MYSSINLDKIVMHSIVELIAQRKMALHNH